jgi:hypothetical protein
MEDKAEEARLRYKYRKLIQSGKIKLPYRSAARIIGPDTAYHLYHNLEKNEIKKPRTEN